MSESVRLADRVVAAAAEGELVKGQTFTALECDDLGIPIREEQCWALTDVLTQFSIYTHAPIDRKLIITPKEKKYLYEEGFSQEFIDALAGPDGKRVLQARVKWLSENVVARVWRSNCNDRERIDMLGQLERIGPDAYTAIPALMEMGLENSEIQSWAIRAVLAIEPDEFARFYYLGRMCWMEETGLQGLIRVLNTSHLDSARCATMALGAMGAPAASAVPELITLAQRTKGTPLEVKAFAALAGIGKSAAPAIPLILRRYEELRNPHLIYHIGSIAEPSPEILNFLEKIVRKNYAYAFDQEGKATISVLAEMGEPALPVLVRSAAAGVSPSLIFPLGEAIRKVGIRKEDIRPLLIALEKYWDEGNKELKHRAYLSAIYALDQEFIDELEEILLNEKEENIRMMAVRVLEVMFNGPARVTPLLVHLLQDKNPKIRKRLADFFGKQGKSAINALPLLVTIRSNRHEIESCRRAAADAITKIENEVL